MAGKIGWVDASAELVRAFEHGIAFGLKVAGRRRDPQWTEDEWREALQNAVGEADVFFSAEGISMVTSHPVIMSTHPTTRIFIDLPEGGWHELRRDGKPHGFTPMPLTEGVWGYLQKLAKKELGRALEKPTAMAAKAGR